MNTIDLCNLALDHIGASNPIQSLDEGSREASVCGRHYTPALEALLRTFDWSFARAYNYTSMIDDGSVPIPDQWLYAYAYPNDAVRVWCVHQNPRIGKPPLHEVASMPSGQGQVIFTTVTPALFRYTRRISDAGYFDPAFALALSYTLAERICYPLTRDTKQVDIFRKLALEQLAYARTASANESPEDPYAAAPDWIAARGEVA